MAPPRQFDGPASDPASGPVATHGESLGPDAEALDRPLEAAIRQALQREMPAQAARRHLDAIRAFSPERYPDHGTRPGADIVPIGRARSRRTGARRAVVAAIAAAMLLTLGAGSAIAASTDAKPGDALYGVKRASERIAVAMRRSPESKAALHLKFAERRIDEIDALAAEGKDVTDLAADFAEELEAAGALASDEAFARILERTRQHIAHLNQILGSVPEQAQKGLETAIENAERQQERTEQRRLENQERRRDGGRPDAPGNSGDAPGNSGR